MELKGIDLISEISLGEKNSCNAFEFHSLVASLIKEDTFIFSKLGTTREVTKGINLEGNQGSVYI